jgi:hypothetical protein
MAHAQKPDSVFQRNGRVHLNRRGCQFSGLLAVEECACADSECITFSKYVDHSLKMSLQGRKQLVESAVCDVWVCMCVAFVMCGCVCMCVAFMMCGCVFMCVDL